MLIIKEIENGKFMVSSDAGNVDIGNGAVKSIIVSKDEISYIDEVKDNLVKK